jgi:hypothetical protein
MCGNINTCPSFIICVGTLVNNISSYMAFQSSIGPSILGKVSKKLNLFFNRKHCSVTSNHSGMQNFESDSSCRRIDNHHEGPKGPFELPDSMDIVQHGPRQISRGVERSGHSLSTGAHLTGPDEDTSWLGQKTFESLLVQESVDMLPSLHSNPILKVSPFP